MTITSQEAQLILGVGSRQTLYSIIRKHNIPFKTQANGLSNIYEKSDIENLKKIIGQPNVSKETKKKVKKMKKAIKLKKENIEKTKTKTKEMLNIKDIYCNEYRVYSI